MGARKSCCHNSFPESSSKAATWQFSFMAPEIEVTITARSHTTGLDCPTPVSSAFQATFRSADHFSGNLSARISAEDGPNKAGQRSTGSLALATAKTLSAILINATNLSNISGDSYH